VSRWRLDRAVGPSVSGFRAPLAGTVDAQLPMMVAYEGDLAQTFTRTPSTTRAPPLCRPVQGTSVDCQATICQVPLRRTQTSV
jgi:hypothetical protein